MRGEIIGSGMLSGAIFGGAYAASLVLLLRWFAASKASHVLAIEDGRPRRRVVGGRSVWRILAALGTAVALLAVEANAFARIGAWIPGVSCHSGWAPTAGCLLDAAASRPGRGAALAILLLCVAAFLAARQLIPTDALYPVVLLMSGLLAFGAAADLVAGGEGAARPELVFMLVAGLQLTAAAGLALSLLVMRPRTARAFLRGLLAHIAGAGVRILGAAAMLAMWPHLPAGSAIALLVVVLLVPGVASALTGAAAIASSPDAYAHRTSI